MSPLRAQCTLQYTDLRSVPARCEDHSEPGRRRKPLEPLTVSDTSSTTLPSKSSKHSFPSGVCARTPRRRKESTLFARPRRSFVERKRSGASLSRLRNAAGAKCSFRRTVCRMTCRRSRYSRARESAVPAMPGFRVSLREEVAGRRVRGWKSAEGEKGGVLREGHTRIGPSPPWHLECRHKAEVVLDVDIRVLRVLIFVPSALPPGHLPTL